MISAHYFPLKAFALPFSSGNPIHQDHFTNQQNVKHIKSIRNQQHLYLFTNGTLGSAEE